MDTITPRFVSAKTATTIPAACSLVRDALVQATLDPQVHAIEFIAQARVGASLVNLDAIVLARVDGRFRLDVVEGRQRGRAMWLPVTAVSNEAQPDVCNPIRRP
jgi:hypothetical protein